MAQEENLPQESDISLQFSGFRAKKLGSSRDQRIRIHVSLLFFLTTDCWPD
jgi:hypothetical protein